jgi:hypothetical protein
VEADHWRGPIIRVCAAKQIETAKQYECLLAERINGAKGIGSCGDSVEILAQTN